MSIASDLAVTHPLHSLFAGLRVRRHAHTAARSAAPAVETVEQSLAKCTLLRVAQPLGREVVCVRGCLWLTHDGDPRDVILQTGQRHRADRGTGLLIQALDDAQLRIV